MNQIIEKNENETETQTKDENYKLSARILDIKSRICKIFTKSGRESLFFGRHRDVLGISVDGQVRCRKKNASTQSRGIPGDDLYGIAISMRGQYYSRRHGYRVRTAENVRSSICQLREWMQRDTNFVPSMLDEARERSDSFSEAYAESQASQHYGELERLAARFESIRISGRISVLTRKKSHLIYLVACMVRVYRERQARWII